LSHSEIAMLNVEIIFDGRRSWSGDPSPAAIRDAGRRYFRAGMELAEVWDGDVLADPASRDGRKLLPMSLDEWVGELWGRIEEATTASDDS
jgi:hypothetical protein